MAFRPEFVDSAANRASAVVVQGATGSPVASTITRRRMLNEVALSGDCGAPSGALGDVPAPRSRPLRG